MENVIIKIRNELIRAISGIDAWFDKEDALLEHKPNIGSKTVREVLQDVMLANRYLLSIIDNGRTNASIQVVDIPMDKYSLKSKLLEDAVINSCLDLDKNAISNEASSLPEVRHEIREQLDRCLIHLELLMEGRGVLFKTNLAVGELGNLDIYQSIYFLAIHVRRYLGELDNILKDYNQEMEKA